MNSNRSLLVMGLLLVSFLLFTQWQQDFNPEIQAQKQAQIQAQQAPHSPRMWQALKVKPSRLKAMYYA